MVLLLSEATQFLDTYYWREDKNVCKVFNFENASVLEKSSISWYSPATYHADLSVGLYYFI